MAQFDKAKLSKDIGWDPSNAQRLPIPAAAESIISCALMGDEQSALTVLRWYRFCASAVNADERKIQDAIYEACQKLFA
jgi:hypothetical protein